MRSMKAKVLTAAATITGLSMAVAASCVGKGALCYNETYTSANIGQEVIDVMGASGAFIYSNITLIGILLLLGFIVGVFVSIKNKVF